MDAPLWERLLVSIAGPLVTIALGTVLVGRYLGDRTRREEDRRRFEFRDSLVEDIVRSASALELALNVYGRESRRTDSYQRPEAAREHLDEQYLNSRVEAAAIERRLRAYFSSSEPASALHAAMDLLTVRYFDEIGLATDELLRSNAGPDHSGLSANELRDKRLTREAFSRVLDRCLSAVLGGEFKVLLTDSSAG